MRRLFFSFVLVCLVSWFLPLGAFIKPSQEKWACDGKRAFHMCSMMTGHANPNRSADSKMVFSAAGAFHDFPKSAGAAGGDFTVDDAFGNLSARDSKVAKPIFHPSPQSFSPSIFHPPRLAIL